MKKILAIILIITGLFAGFVILPEVTGTIGTYSERLRAGDERAVTDEIKSIAELSVLKYEYSNAARITDKKTLEWLDGLKLPFTGKTIVIKYDGIIKLGVNADEIEVKVNKDISGKLSSIDVTLPEVKITSHEIDRKGISFAEEKNNIINQIKIEDYNRLEKKAKSIMEKAVKNQNIMNRAGAETRDRIGSMLKSIYDSDVEINFN